MPDGRDFSKELFGGSTQQPAAAAGRDMSAQLFGAPTQQPGAERTWLDSAGDYLGALWKNANPVALVTGTKDAVNSAITQPIETLKSIGNAQDQPRLKAEEAFKRGDYAEGIRHAIGYLIPLVGPQIDASGNKAQEGKVAEALGEATAIGVTQALPASPALKNVKVPAVVKNRLNQVEQAAVNFADQKGIPIPLSVRSGSRAARGLEGAMANDVGGAGFAAEARAATTDALKRTGDDLAGQIHPTVETTETAGKGVVGAMKKKIQDLDRTANAEYKVFHQIEQDPLNQQAVQVGVDATGKPVMKTMALPIDMRPVKDALRPIVEKYERALPDAEIRASRGLKAMKNILKEEDFKPASAAEMDLGALKETARAEMPELRDVSQGLAAQSVEELSNAIEAAVAKANVQGAAPGSTPALDALKRGRKLTAEKWEAGDLLKTFGRDMDPEPVQVFQALTWERDAGIDRLRDIKKAAPGEIPKIARAYVEGLLEQATRGGDFAQTQAIFNKWKSLGRETKRELFGNPKLIEDLDNFFELARKANQNPNPSGTAYVTGVQSHVATFVTGLGLVVWEPTAGAGVLGAGALRVIGNNALARLLYSPRASAALTKGMKIPTKGPQAAAAAAQILKIAGDDAKPLDQSNEDSR